MLPQHTEVLGQLPGSYSSHAADPGAWGNSGASATIALQDVGNRCGTEPPRVEPAVETMLAYQIWRMASIIDCAMPCFPGLHRPRSAQILCTRKKRNANTDSWGEKELRGCSNSNLRLRAIKYLQLFLMDCMRKCHMQASYVRKGQHYWVGNRAIFKAADFL